MKIFTIGFTKRSAEEFFGAISENNIDILIDTRINNKSQLAGFSKGKDLPFFLKKLSDCKYEHELLYAPTNDLLKKYKAGVIDWKDYEREYLDLIDSRDVYEHFLKKYTSFSNIVLLCSENTAEKCHRRILADYISDRTKFEVEHL